MPGTLLGSDSSLLHVGTALDYADAEKRKEASYRQRGSGWPTQIRVIDTRLIQETFTRIPIPCDIEEAPPRHHG
jgi:hypothetical protein